MKRVIITVLCLGLVGCIVGWVKEEEPEALRFFMSQRAGYGWLIEQIEKCKSEGGKPDITRYGGEFSSPSHYQVYCWRP